MSWNERPIPEPVFDDPEAVEMLRVWVANRKLYCAMKVGMYKEATKIPEEKAWGIILADVARHVSLALKEGYQSDDSISLVKIRESFLEEMAKPTSQAKGEFA